MSLPTLTAEDRAAALAKAGEARKERAEVKRQLKAGETTLAEVVKDAATNVVLAKMAVLDLLRAMPGVGDVRAKQIMERLGINESRRIGGLGTNQRSVLEAEFAPAFM